MEFYVFWELTVKNGFWIWNLSLLFLHLCFRCHTKKPLSNVGMWIFSLIHFFSKSFIVFKSYIQVYDPFWMCVYTHFCMVWSRESQVIILHVNMTTSSCPNIICQKNCSFPSEFSLYFVKNHFTINVRANFRTVII